MPCILKLRIVAARGLPAIDGAAEFADVYVEVRLGDLEPLRTRVCQKTLDPVWNEDFRIEVSDDIVLQDDPLELRVYDYDAITADDSFGVVMIDLNSLLTLSGSQTLSGWFPIYNTIRGMRGELSVQARVQFFEDTNPFKESSAGIRVFSSRAISEHLNVRYVVGFVDQVLTEVDPDYHWVDRFRTLRSSNEASNKLLQQLGCRLRRQMGRKALEMGGNAIVGYCQELDFETYAQTITVRGVGTAVWISGEDQDADAEMLNLPDGSVELLTVDSFPPSVVKSLYGVVTARAVKCIADEPAKDDIRDKWLTELREDIKSNAKLLGCSVVLGYSESVVIHDDAYVLSAEGTAARIDYSSRSAGPIVSIGVDCGLLHFSLRRQKSPMPSRYVPCRLCRRRKVPEMLLTTCDPPHELERIGPENVLIEAFVCRELRKKREGEVLASTISSVLPFVEYDVHRQLVFKLRYFGLNAAFGLCFKIAMNDKAIIATATCTGVFIAALPQPSLLQISRNIEIRDEEDASIAELQKTVLEKAGENRNRISEACADHPVLQLHSESENDSATSSDSDSSSSSDDDDEKEKVAIVQIDDETDEDIVLLLASIDNFVPRNNLSTCEKFSGVPQLLSMVKKDILVVPGRHLHYQLSLIFDSLYKELYACVAFESFVVSGISTMMTLDKNFHVTVTCTATVLGNADFDSVDQTSSADSSSASGASDSDIEVRLADDGISFGSPKQNLLTRQKIRSSRNGHVDLLAQSWVSEMEVSRNIGNISVQILRETNANEIPGASPAFTSTMVTEGLALMRAHASALGGNSVLGLQITPKAFYQNMKNQLHGVISISGDVVYSKDVQKKSWTGIFQNQSCWNKNIIR